MEVLIVVGLFVVSAAVAGGLVWFSAKVERERREAFEARGWTYTRKGRHFKVEGVTDGVIWQHELTPSSSKNTSRESAIWRCPARCAALARSARGATHRQRADQACHGDSHRRAGHPVGQGRWLFLSSRSRATAWHAAGGRAPMS